MHACSVSRHIRERVANGGAKLTRLGYVLREMKP
jgi:hypothetical protein